MTDPSNTSSDESTPGGEMVLERSITEAHTLYVLPGDVLVLPCGDGIPAAVATSMQEVHDLLGLKEMIITSGVGAPWILRKATLAEPE